MLLANYFLERSFSSELIPTLATDVIDSLLAHSWPGNVRELEQAIVAAAAMCQDKMIRVSDLPLPKRESPAGKDSFEHLRGLPLTEAKALLVEQFERSAIEAALADNCGNISAAARHLGLHRQSLQQKLTQLGLHR